MGCRKWARISTYTLSERIQAMDVSICPNTVGKLLKKLDYSLKSNKKSIAATQHPDRNQQFEIIAQKRKRFEQLRYPIISVDTKKKELVGNFRNPGKTYCKEVEKVYDHDFPSQAIGKANPYGIYELLVNKGTVIVGTSHDTPEFAVESIKLWLLNSGFKRYKNFEELLILCDTGGSNSCSARAWKYGLYSSICKKLNIAVTICHYPSGASKWNPIEHRLFSYITQNWAGKPLRSYEIILKYIQTTTTKTGLKVESFLNEKEYKKAIKISDEDFEQINIKNHDVLPRWNYTIYP
jgi:hypothetical protein